MLGRLNLKGRLWLPVSLLVLAMAAVGQAKADQLFVVFDGTGAGQGVNIQFKGSSLGVFAGQFFMHLEKGGGKGPGFNSFCVDLDDDMHVGQKYAVAQRSTNDGLSSGASIAWLYNKFGKGIVGDAKTAAALQIAIWDLEYDGGNNLKSGDFQYLANDDLAAMALSFINDAKNHKDTAGWLDGSKPSPDFPRGQNVLDPGNPGGGTTPTPEPGTAVLLGLGLAGLVGYRRWKK